MSKLGGSDWANTKRKARKAVREIAGELVQLYAARQAAPGHAFGPDTPVAEGDGGRVRLHRDPVDQLTVIAEVKADMEKPVPMDRVVIGDVGYGKTEIAVRAAFKAVQDGKQVAVLVPTTLLAQQHLQTFTERMAAFPVMVKGLSRFTDAAESRRPSRGMADGTVDIVVGTHRLLQTGIRWKDLGLVVVDEEQRFGVEHKEHIKALRTHVDVLTMSATPIPRTLEMSMAGIREMSTILTPPEERHPILTYVGGYNDKQVAAAIRRELLRDGQVFYVHNRVSSIDKAAKKIRDLVPEARVVVAHGQMNEDTLEKTVQGFWERDFDVLVCTTIVETGLDIPNANTLIVERADSLGLSQLHQLRGRVGRSRERGYAYFLYPQEKPLTETAYDRLATISQNSDLGAGMAVAMKDLEIRGAGNVLGAEQSGHVAGVGFDLYVRLVGEAVEAFRAAADGRPISTDEAPKEVRIDLPVDAHIPSDYVTSDRLRLEAYRKLAAANDDNAIDSGHRRTRRSVRSDAGGGPEARVGREAAPAVPGVRPRRGHRGRLATQDRFARIAGLEADAAQAAVPVRAVPPDEWHRAVADPAHGRYRFGSCPRRRAASVHRGLPPRDGRKAPGLGGHQCPGIGGRVSTEMTGPGDMLREAAKVMDRLWAFGGWEVTQTHESLRRYLVEETYEVLDAIESGDPDSLREELGDLLLQVLFHSRIAEESGAFTVDDVAATLVAKLAARSPHLSNGHTGPLDVAEQEAAWEVAKRAEKARESCLDGIAMAQPSLALADKVLERARRAGFPDELVPDELRTVRIDGSGDTEAALRGVVLRFADAIRTAERSAGAGPHDAEIWKRHWRG